MASLRDRLQRDKRSALAVDFGADFVAVRHAPPGGEWVELGVVSVQAPDFVGDMTALAAIAREATGGDLRAELWLPASQIVNLEIEGQSRIEFLARRTATNHLAEAIGITADLLSYDLSKPHADGCRSACATEASTVEEARRHAAAWGFVPTTITTRHAGPAFTRPPCFDAAAPKHTPLPVIAAAAAVVVLLGVGGMWVMQDGPYEPPVVDLKTVATAPVPASEPTSSEDGVELETAGSTPSQAGSPLPEASPTVEASAPTGSETRLDFSVAADTRPLFSPEADLPVSVQDETRLSVENVVTGEMVPAQSAEPKVARAFVADQTPVAPPRPKIVAIYASDTANDGLSADAVSPPRGDAALAAAAPLLTNDARGALPGASLSDRSPAPDTDVAPIDPAEYAEDAEKWAEAESNAEAEAGASAPGHVAKDDVSAYEVIVGALTDTAEGAAVEGITAPRGANTRVVGETHPIDDAIFGQADPAQVALLSPSPAIRDQDAGPVLAESDDFDDIDLGPGPGSVLHAPPPQHRPAALDMTPSDLAVLTAPAPGHRPKSIKPRPKYASANARTARAPSRGKPSGPGLSRAATLEEVLPLDDLSLLGTFGQGRTRRALLRMPTGQVVRVSRGDVVQGWVVGKIENLSMRITRGGEARTLPLAR